MPCTRLRTSATLSRAIAIPSARCPSRSLAPAIRYAHDGYPVSEQIAAAWANNAARMRQFPDTARTYLFDGQPPQA
ncbi:MAG: gamma-glutamyltransferase, partial [Bacteroidales bacterium]